MSEVEAEALIRRVVRECAARVAVSDPLVKAVVSGPRNGFNVDRTLTQQDIHNVKELCLGQLQKCSLRMATIKMQLHFNMNYKSRREFLEAVKQTVQSKLSPLRRRIMESRASTPEELQAMYQDFVSYILLHSGMDAAADPQTVRETAAASQSIFPQSKLGVFMLLSTKEKEAQLQELSLTVTGIRLCRKASQEGKEQLHGHHLMPAVVNYALDSMKSVLRGTESLSWRYTAVLEKLAKADSPPGLCDVPVDLLKQALYNVRQHQHFLNILQADAHMCIQHIEMLKTELLCNTEQLKQTVQGKEAVPTTLVFPLFRNLSQVWGCLRDEAELLRTLHNFSISLQPFLASQADTFPADYLDTLLGAAEVKTDAQRMNQSSDQCVDRAMLKLHEWFWPSGTEEVSELPLEYNGFCGYTLAVDGILLPGNPKIGVLKHKEKLYAFSSKEAALTFVSQVDDFVSQVAEKVKQSPELLQLLQLHPQCSSTRASSEPGEKSQMKRDCGAQTEIHPIETNIDKSYEWNEWELRRKALKLADLRSKATLSTQTDRSHMRRENISQTWKLKNAACVTKRDGQSSMPTPQVYLAGLRGQKHSQAVKTNLISDVDYLNKN